MRPAFRLASSLVLSIMMLSPSLVAAEPQDRPAPPAHREKRLQWVTGNEGGAPADRQALQMSREERRALRRELHESRKELRHPRRERAGR